MPSTHLVRIQSFVYFPIILLNDEIQAKPCPPPFLRRRPSNGAQSSNYFNIAKCRSVERAQGGCVWGEIRQVQPQPAREKQKAAQAGRFLSSVGAPAADHYTAGATSTLLSSRKAGRTRCRDGDGRAVAQRDLMSLLRAIPILIVTDLRHLLHHGPSGMRSQGHT